jgi:hypothetical protein
MILACPQTGRDDWFGKEEIQTWGSNDIAFIHGSSSQ